MDATKTATQRGRDKRRRDAQAKIKRVDVAITDAQLAKLQAVQARDSATTSKRCTLQRAIQLCIEGTAV